MKYVPKMISVLFTIAALSVTVACSSGGASDEATPSGSAITGEQATEMLQHALEGYNRGDYQAWSRDWTPTLKSAIPADAFGQFRERSMARLGRFVSIEAVELTPGNDPGYVRWVATARFEHGRAQLALAMKSDARSVEGSFVNPVE